MEGKRLYKVSVIVLVAIWMTVFVFLEFWSTNGAAATKSTKTEFSQAVSELKVGGNAQFKVKGVKNQEKYVKWKSSRPEVATVSKHGKVTAVSEGTTVIRAVVKKTGKTVKAKLRVTREEEEWIQKDFGEMPSEEDRELEHYLNKDIENSLIKRLDTSEKSGDTSVDKAFQGNYNHINDFCYQVFKKVVEKKEENANPVTSPISAYFALAMAADGAAGNTKKQFDELLSEAPCDTIGAVRRQFEQINNDTKTTLCVENSVWLDDEFIANQNWLSHLSGSGHHAEIYQTALETDAAREGINNWVSNQTKGLIPQLLAENLDDARLALINAIYLKARWSEEFEEYATSQKEFTNEDNTKKMTDFMNQEGRMPYFQLDDMDGIIKYYDDGKLAFIALRPQAGQTARELAASLTADKAAACLSAAKSTKVSLHLPKFTVEYDMSMNSILEELGLTDAFDENRADFTALGQNIYGIPPFISQVLQKVKVIVDEQGTEAAAVTAIIMEDCLAVIEQDPPLDISFDEPFVYLIADTKMETGAEGETACVPLFMGVVTEF